MQSEHNSLIQRTDPLYTMKAILPSDAPMGNRTFSVDKMSPEGFSRLCSLEIWNIDEAICGLHGVNSSWKDYPYCDKQSHTGFGGTLNFKTTREIVDEAFELKRMAKYSGNKVVATIFLCWAIEKNWTIPPQFNELVQKAQREQTDNFGVEEARAMFVDSPKLPILLSALKNVPKNYLQAIVTCGLMLCWAKQKDLVGRKLTQESFLESKFGTAISKAFGQQERVTKDYFKMIFPDTPPKRSGRPKKTLIS
jgi:hypothetical protein